MRVKILLFLVSFFVFASIAHCQSVVTFDQLPANYQLFARDSTNQATVIVSGTATAPGPDSLSVELWREGKLRSRSGIMLAVSRPSSFSSSVRIRAEKAQYTIRVYTHTGRDSTLIAERTRLVCGDFIQLYGQSNAAALSPNYAFDDTYLRNFATSVTSDPSEGKVVWYPAKQPYGGSGMIGWRLQELILEHFGIPTCIVNGAVGGKESTFCITEMRKIQLTSLPLTGNCYIVSNRHRHFPPYGLLSGNRVKRMPVVPSRLPTITAANSISYIKTGSKTIHPSPAFTSVSSISCPTVTPARAASAIFSDGQKKYTLIWKPSPPLAHPGLKEFTTHSRATSKRPTSCSARLPGISISPRIRYRLIPRIFKRRITTVGRTPLRWFLTTGCRWFGPLTQP